MNIKHIYSTQNDKWIENKVVECVHGGAAHLTLEDSRHQTLTGLGGCFNELGKLGLDTLSKKESSKILDKLFGKDSEMKFEFCRLPIGASDYAEQWYSHNETDGDYEMTHFNIDRDKKILIPYIKEALKRNPDLKLFASPWSPPSWMKFPKAYNYGTLVWTEKNLKAYALYLAKFIEAYAADGITVQQLHIQNEVFADQKFPSCLWTAEQLAEFTGKYLGPVFEERNLTCEIWLGTINGDENRLECDFSEMAFKVLTDDIAQKYIKGVSYQWFGKNSVERNVECFPDIPVIQSENECGDGKNTWEYAKYVFKLMRHYLNAGAEAYTYWNMILNSNNGASTWGWEQNAMISVENGTVTYNHEYYVFKHFSGFIGSGSIRCGLSGMFSGLSSAFETPDGKTVLIILNPLDRKFDLKLNAHGKEFIVSLEADSVNTVIADK